nr:nonribosomal peptide synthetase tes [Quercus suber]
MPAAPRDNQDGVDLKSVRKVLGDVLCLPLREVQSRASFLDLGGDSVTALEFSARCSTLNIRVQVKDILECGSLDELAARMSYRKESWTTDSIEPWSLAPHSGREHVEREVREQSKLPAAGHEISDIYPATALQEGLMALAVKQPGSYVSEYQFTLAAAVDIERFKAAWAQVVEACPILRTRIVLIGGRFWQAVIAEDVHWETAALNDGKTMEYGSKLCHYALYTRGSEHRFHVRMHHAIFDGWCLGLLSETLAQCYYHGSHPERSLVPFVKFVDYALKMDSLASRNYWQNQLSAAKRTMFPSLHQVHSASTPSGSKTVRHNFKFSSRPKSITMATILRAAWAVVLAAYEDRAEDVTFGSTVVGRQVPIDRIEHIAGPVISTVPVRIRLDQTQSVAQFLQDIQSQASEMIEFEQLGLQNISKLSTDAQAACQFSTLLVVQPHGIWTRANNSLLTLQDSALISYDLNNAKYYNYPLVLQGHLYDDEVGLYMTYDTSILCSEQVERIAVQYEWVVQQLLSQGPLTLADVSVCAPSDVDQILQWQVDEEQPATVDACVHDLISAKAAGAPAQEAIFAWDGLCTYTELDEMTTTLAAHLRERGVKAESLIPISFEKSMWTIVAMLAIMKAGGAFVPLNPDHPPSRRQALIAGLEAPLMLASPATADACKDLGLPVVHVSASLLSTLSQPADAGWATTPSTPAYVLFTSGSTGMPKGVVIEHSALASSIRGHGTAFGIQSSSRVLQFSSYVFDACVVEIFTTLASGGTVCVPSDEARLSNVTEFMKLSNVNWALLTPSFVQSFHPADVPCLETLVLGGEAPKKGNYEAWYGKVRLMNAYGPAEACIVASTQEVQHIDARPSTIGRGCNTSLWIVEPDNHDRLTPVGCIGELLVQGPTLAREYLNDAEKTARAFIRSPSWLPSGPFTRLYKTGDLVRYNDDGTIDYVGRKDVQIKIRGQRVEPGEVEHHVKQYLGPRSSAAVLVVQDAVAAGSAALVAFMCVDTQAGTASAEAESAVLPKNDSMADTMRGLDHHLRTILPDYMVPTYFLPVQQLPLTSSGKIDGHFLRRAVLGMTAEGLAQYSLSARGEVRPPATAMEWALRDVWAAVLGLPVDKIGRDDSFLQLGGDSISAIRLVRAAREAGLVLTVKDVFDDARLFSVAARAEEIKEDAQPQKAAAFSLLSNVDAETVQDHVREQCGLSDHQAIEDAYPCTSLQDGLMALAAKQPGSYMAKWVYRVPAHIDLMRFRSAVGADCRALWQLADSHHKRR